MDVFSFLAAKALAVTVNPNIPAMNPVSASSGPGAFVANFYQFALMIAGVLALGAIVFGGVKYAASAGNPSAQSDGKEWILGALYGLLLLAGAYLILYTVNPNLTNLNPPALVPVNIGAAQGTLPSVQCGNVTCNNALCLTNSAGQQYCQQFSTSSTNPSAACQGLPGGCTLYNPINPPSPSCPANLPPLNCVAGAPGAAVAACYVQINC